MTALITAFALLLLIGTTFYFHGVRMLGTADGDDGAAFRSFSDTTVLTEVDHTLVFDGTSATMAVLPDAAMCAGRVYSISNFSNAIPTPTLTITPKDRQRIDGEPLCSLYLLDQSVVLISDGANWKILKQFIPISTQPWKTQGCSVSYRSTSAEKLCKRSSVFYEVSGN